jgi:hypothetical protein
VDFIRGRPKSARPSVSLTSATPLGRPLKELDGLRLQDGGQLPDDLQAHVGHAPLDPAQVGPVHPRVVGQLLLGQLPVISDNASLRRFNSDFSERLSCRP